MEKFEIGDDDELSFCTAVLALKSKALPEKSRQRLSVRAEDRHLVVLF